jgi:hypothetical protein
MTDRRKQPDKHEGHPKIGGGVVKSGEFIIEGDTDIKEASSLLKDGVTTLVGIQTAAIGAIFALRELR